MPSIVIYTRKKNRYIFYTYSCIAVHNGVKELLQCEYNTDMELILNENVFDLWKKWLDYSDGDIYKAIDYNELFKDSNRIYSTQDNEATADTARNAAYNNNAHAHTYII